MLESEVFPKVAADVAMQAIKEGIARKPLSWDEVYAIAKDIQDVHRMREVLSDNGLIKAMDNQMIQDAFDWAVQQIEK